ncbi:hypothetical protein GCM10007160_17930 [Litchfieldella qijiaojingensis]|uniref:Uncharacterized protein n=1 Tax=Litchfieldella qijiaojingensis TaxID=980347 RepID=A0ABQ2YPV0_9GAMM|nr:hypothetical protein [Halomonas qijiaojingensis]GGX90880.1 hypothetical protein GCM10007160_17930 [Halomonas qijiaojingensis]
MLAVIGLRHIRRDPERRRGRMFCWSAIALALILAVLAAWIGPSIAVSAVTTPSLPS